jgi:hypothetical protein
MRFLFVERATAGECGLVGACVLARANPRRAFPLAHLRAYPSPHSYLSGFLIDREEAEPAIRAPFSFRERCRLRRHTPWSWVWRGSHLTCPERRRSWTARATQPVRTSPARYQGDPD